jgi:hypothetical protein
VNHETVWTAERVQRLEELWRAGHSAALVARELGITRGAVIGKVNRLDLPERVTSTSATASIWPPERVRRLEELWWAGHSAALIARELGVTRGAVIRKARRLGLLEPPADREEIAAERALRNEKIAALGAEGMRPVDIARALGIPPSIVWRILPRRLRPPVDREKIIAMSLAGMGPTAIAKALGISRDTVRYLRRKARTGVGIGTLG